MVKLDFLSVLDEKAQFLYNFSDGIWADPETAFTEFHAAGRYCSALRSEGFEVTENLAGSPRPFPAASVPVIRSSACWRNLTRSPA